ncbi:hypothetical protein FLJC2902T_11760 [Flavobacterium limnosediminis JC2902]|uniref:DinB-like domain-containing protein n=1 Tax=Flavobacterium limnosediminis JC2902 TaxID=1341181 RepID=V6SXK0_9FLAO|nr:DinB family protein [Flavobacterium limnosediminis]ESU29135.1 hypothetical protein FLJC2902T_11760 [Flavobacterium limnosediminis JC2902]
MEATFKILETNRAIYHKFLDNYSLEQLNCIPEGFSNNLIWNIGHIVVAQQGLVYRLSGLPTNISSEMTENYKNGSKPDGNTTQEEVDEIRRLLLSLPEQTKSDYEAGKFQNFNEYQTQTGFHLGSFKDAMEFNNYHEGMHLGFMMQIRKFL